MVGDSTGKEGLPHMILRSRVTDESEISANTDFLELWNRFGPPSLFFSFRLPYPGQLCLPETPILTWDIPVQAHYYVIESKNVVPYTFIKLFGLKTLKLHLMVIKRQCSV